VFWLRAESTLQPGALIHPCAIAPARKLDRPLVEQSDPPIHAPCDAATPCAPSGASRLL